MAETKMQLADWLDDLCVRFIVNLPQEELESAERICFQVEEAQWFYEDFIRPLDASLPSMSLRTFCMAIFKVCPLLSTFTAEHHLAAYSQFLAYKTRVPVRGAILLNKSMDQVLLVKGWKKGASWSFPRGKINKDERDLDCAVREVYEETGYDLVSAGLVPDEETVKSVEVTMREQHMKLYVFRDVPMDTVFQARTRKEISKIMWWKLSQLPGYHKRKTIKTNTSNAEESGDSVRANKLYMVAPFLPQLKKWISQQRKTDSHRRTTSDAYMSTGDMHATDADVVLEDDLPSDVPAQSLAPMAYDFSTALPQMVSSNSAGNLPQETSPDAAAQMKLMLGISDFTAASQAPVHPPQSHAADHQTNLLNLLRQNHQGQPAPASVRAAADHQRGFPNVARQPPPMPTPLASQIPSSQPHQQLSPPWNGQLGFQGSQPPLSQPYPGRVPVPQEQHFAGQLPFGHRLQQDLGHYQDPVTLQYSGRVQAQQFGRPAPGGQPSSLSQQPPSVPKASELPMPKLSNHAQNLLSMFKTPSAPSTQEPTHSQAHPAATYESRPFGHSIGQASEFEAPSSQPLPPPRRSSSKSAFGSLIPNSVSPASPSTGARPGTPARKQSEASNRQANLLTLLKSSASDQVSGQPVQSETRKASMSSNQEPRPVSKESAALLGLFKNAGPVSSLSDTPITMEKRPSSSSNSDALLGPLKQTDQPKPNDSERPSQVLQQPHSTQTGSATRATTQQDWDMPVLSKSTGPKKMAVSPQIVPKILQRSPKQPFAASPPPNTSQASPKNVFSAPQQAEQQQQTTTRKKKQAPKTALQKAEKNATAPMGPVQILKRPTSNGSQRTAPTLGAQPAVQSALPEARTVQPPAQSLAPSISMRKAPSSPLPFQESFEKSPKKTFTPQILQRPKAGSSERLHQESKSQSASSTTQAPTSKDEQQRALLSLLNSSTQRPSTSGSSIPASPATRPEFSRSRIGSIASPPADSAVRSRLGSEVSVKSGPSLEKAGVVRDKPAQKETGEGGVMMGKNVSLSGDGGEQSPISPADRGFLVSYLEGVIGGRKGRP